MTKYTDYTAYFEQLATDILQHSPEEKHFYRKGLDEFLNGLKTDVNYPALLLDKYDYKYTDNGADNVMKPRTIAFIVCDNTDDIMDYERIDEIMDLTEEIVDKIYNRLHSDIRPPYHDFLKYAKLGEVQVSPIENYTAGNYGYFCTIEIFSHHNTSIQ